jgi:hypothetical protein
MFIVPATGVWWSGNFSCFVVARSVVCDGIDGLLVADLDRSHWHFMVTCKVYVMDDA